MKSLCITGILTNITMGIYFIYKASVFVVDNRFPFSLMYLIAAALTAVLGSFATKELKKLKPETIKVSTYAPPGHGKTARNAEELQKAIQTRDETK